TTPLRLTPCTTWGSCTRRTGSRKKQCRYLSRRQRASKSQICTGQRRDHDRRIVPLPRGVAKVRAIGCVAAEIARGRAGERRAGLPFLFSGTSESRLELAQAEKACGGGTSISRSTGHASQAWVTILGDVRESVFARRLLIGTAEVR